MLLLLFFRRHNSRKDFGSQAQNVLCRSVLSYGQIQGTPQNMSNVFSTDVNHLGDPPKKTDHKHGLLAQPKGGRGPEGI